MDYTQLIKELRTSDESGFLCDTAANAVEALQARVVELEKDRDEWKDSTIAANDNAAREEKRRRDIQEQRDAAQAKLRELEGQERNKVPEAWTNLLAYVLQGDMYNRLTPRVIDIAYNAFMLAKSANKEDGGASDWFNDTKPAVEELIAKLRKDLVEELESARPVPAAPTALELMTEYSNGKQWALERTLTDAEIKAIMLANGFTIKEGLDDLKPYVYTAARAIEAALKGGA